MPLFEHKTVLTAKAETTYGTDSVPTGAANAMLVENLSVNPLEQESDERKSIRPYFGNQQRLRAGDTVSISFDVELAGSGAAGTAPPYAALLRMCAMGETLVVSTSAAYNPITSSIESGTLYFYADGVLHKALGCRGEVGIKLSAKKIPTLSFSFKGLYSPVTDVALASPTLTAFQTPLVANSTNTTPFSIHGYAGVLSDFSLQLGNKVTYRSLIGSESIIIEDRDVTGKLTIEAVTVATKDFFALARASTLGAFTITHGTAAGNKATIAGSAVQLANPTYSTQDGIRMLNLDLIFTPTSAGNDEVTITYT